MASSGRGTRLVSRAGQWRPTVANAVAARPRLRDLALRGIDWRDRWWRRPQELAGVPLPPATLRFRVHGDIDPASFLETGRQCSQDLRAALARVGRDLGSFGDVLDFGCGCGRTLLWFGDAARSARFYGTDIDADAIAWCRRHIPFARFGVNDASPPLACPAGSFDLAYAVSVFTHLDEAHQFQWLQELQRVLRAGGYVLLTVHGSNPDAPGSPAHPGPSGEAGFVFAPMPTPAMRGFFPDWYQHTTHTEAYVRATYTRYFSVVDYVPRGLDHSQDVVVLQKP
jgi:SAM-dependent methyltransferase